MEGLPKNLTAQAQKVFDNALESARSLKHNYVGTEHILIGLLQEETDPACRLFQSLGVDLGKVRSAVEFIITRGERVSPEFLGEDPKLTPRARTVIRIAQRAVRESIQQKIRTVDILVALVQEGEGIAAGVLEASGISRQRLVSAASALGIP